MKLPISRLNYPSQPINDNTFMVVDKEVDGTWKSYKVTLRGIRNYIIGSGDSDTDMYKITLDPNGGTIEGSSEARTIELSAGPLGDRLPIPTP